MILFLNEYFFEILLIRQRKPIYDKDWVYDVNVCKLCLEIYFVDQSEK